MGNFGRELFLSVQRDVNLENKRRRLRWEGFYAQDAGFDPYVRCLFPEFKFHAVVLNKHSRKTYSHIFEELRNQTFPKGIITCDEMECIL